MGVLLVCDADVLVKVIPVATIIHMVSLKALASALGSVLFQLALDRLVGVIVGLAWCAHDLQIEHALAAMCTYLGSSNERPLRFDDVGRQGSRRQTNVRRAVRVVFIKRNTRESA